MSSLISNASGNVNTSIALDTYNVADTYTLQYTVSNIGSGQSYFDILATYSDASVKKYFVPVVFVGNFKQVLPIGECVSIRFKMIGDAAVSSIDFDSDVSEELEPVRRNTTYIDNLKNITSSTGKVYAQMVDGILNLTNTAFTNTSGTITQKDGVMTFLNGTTVDNSTMAVQITGGAIRIASNKDSEGNWIWSTSMNGAGVNADTITTGTLSAINVNGVSITGSTINGGAINGVIIRGSTIYVGDTENGNYIEISPDNPIKVWRNGCIVSSLGYTDLDAGKLKINDGNGTECYTLYIDEDGDARIDVDSSGGYYYDETTHKWVEKEGSRKLVITGSVIVDNTLKVGDKDSSVLVATASDISILESRISLLEINLQTMSDTYKVLINSKADQYHTHSCSYETAGGTSHTHTIYSV